MTFFDKVKTIQEKRNTRIALSLDPDFRDKKFQADPQAIIGWAESLLAQVANSICCVKLQAACYYALQADVMGDITALAHGYGLPVILDHKHNDIGPVAAAYAYGSFDRRKADALTVNAYMGSDSVLPFTKYTGKAVFVLACTSNPSAREFQYLETADGSLYLSVARAAARWGDMVGLVVGATQPEAMTNIRAISDAWFLAPGLGAQGADAAVAMRAAGRNIIFPIARAIANADNPATAAQQLRDGVNKGLHHG